MRVDAAARCALPVEVVYELTARRVEVGPVGGAAALGATDHPRIEAPRLLEIADLHGDVKGGEEGAAHLREDSRGSPAPPVRPCTGGRRVPAPGAARVSAPLTSLRRRSLRAPAAKSRKNDLEDVEGEPSRRLRLQDAAEGLTAWPFLGSVRPPFEPSEHASLRFRG